MKRLLGVGILLVLTGTASMVSALTDIYVDDLQKMYVAYYGRPGDPGGIDYWTDQLAAAQGDLSVIIDAFGSSVEFNDRFGNLSNEQLIHNIYQQALGRDADAEGFAFYSARLDNGEFSLASIALNVVDGIRPGNDDFDLYQNKLIAAKAFTEAIASLGADYTVTEVDAATAFLAGVTAADSREDLVAAANEVVASLGEGSAAESIDITDAIFSARSADCADYQANYQAAVVDIQRSLGFAADVKVDVDNNSCIVLANSIPNHDFNDATAHFATDVAEVTKTFTIPRLPAKAAITTGLTQNTFNGVMLNGVPIDILSAGCYRPNDPRADQDGNVQIGCTLEDNWLVDPLGSESRFGADLHNAHTQPDGLYHYHGDPNAMFDDNPGPEGSPVIGFAADGFPIYGSYFLDPQSGQVRKAVSGYSLKPGDRPVGTANPPGPYNGLYRDDWEYTASGDLDECNGMEVDGQYGYYVTETFPWMIACFRGEPDPSFDKNNGPPM